MAYNFVPLVYISKELITNNCIKLLADFKIEARQYFFNIIIIKNIYNLVFVHRRDPPGAMSFRYIDRVRLKHDLVEKISSNNTLHIFTPLV